MNEFTPTQERMLAVLADGGSHTSAEMVACVNDELASLNTMHVHLTHLRKKLRLKGQDVASERFNGLTCYRHVRLLASAQDGRR